ncbi:MAG: valine--tRNA ligase, partial [Candidatus Micrarchaeales archaeon]
MLDKYDVKEVEKKLIEFWEKEKIYDFSPTSEKKVYAIDTPPTTISGDLHVGHLLSHSQMDFIARYKRMRGYNLFYPYGMDNNGLPTEVLVEHENNVISEQLGRKKFIELVEKSIDKYEDEYKKVWRSISLSVDWSLLYRTIGREAQITSQFSFIELYNMGRVYRKETPTLWCPEDKTAVSQMELEDVTERSKFFYIKFSKDVTIATTRPELLPACVAIFVNPDDKKNAKLVGKRITVPLFENEVKVLSDARVDPEKGTGVVMCCTFGDQTDIEWYKAYGLDLKMVIDESGRMTYGKYKGMKPEEARNAIIDELRKEGKVIKEEEIEHSVNVHERGKHHIEFLVKPQWYVRCMDLKKELLELGSKLKWHPDYMRHRYVNWINGLQWDWCISRQRFFGIPFPIWYCKKCGETKLATKEQLPVNPLVDKPEGKCKKCGSTEFIPEADVMDTWATSSVTPLINARWATDKKYMNKMYPMSLRPQGNDIISTWLFTTILKCYLHTKKLPWSDAFISGYGLDPQSRPMHKSLGNVIGASMAIDKYGADPIRYWAASANLGEDASFQEKDMVSGQRLVNKLWNVAKFVDKACESFNGGTERTIDKWILSKAMLLVKDVTFNLENYNYAAAKRLTEEFFWFFSDNYLEFVKYRVYSKDASPNYTLATVFLTVLKLFAPFLPFVTEEIYQGLFRKRLEKSVSIHSSPWPRYDEKLVDEKSIKEGDTAQKVIEFVRQWKHNNKLALNSEISELLVNVDLADTAEDVKGAMNVKQLSKGGMGTVIPETEIAVE